MDVRTRRELAAKRAKVMEKITSILNENLPELTPKDDPELRSRCNYCEQPGKDYCGVCKSARYCSRECQVKDHPHHKHLCKSYANFNDAKRPSADHVRGILFPTSEQKPKLVWCKQKVVDGKTTVYAAEHIGRYRDGCSILSINQCLKLVGRANTGHGLVACLESTDPVPGCPLNKCYKALGVPGHMMPRFGNILFLGTKLDPDPEHEGKNVVLDDADLRDYRHAIDCLQMHEMNFAAGPAERIATLAEKPDTMPALLIHGDGAMARWTVFTANPQLQRMQPLVTRISPPLLRGTTCAVEQDHAVGARKVGLDWFFRCYGLESHGLAPQDVTPAVLRNPAARHLFPRAPTYNERRNERLGLQVADDEGRCARMQEQQVGSMLLLQRSGAQIHPEHVEVLNLFLDSVARFDPFDGLLSDATDDDELWVSKEKHGEAEAAKAFKQFWADWKQGQEAKGVPVGHLRCPYELQGDVDPGKVMMATIMNKFKRGCKAVDEKVAELEEKGVVVQKEFSRRSS